MPRLPRPATLRQRKGGEEPPPVHPVWCGASSTPATPRDPHTDRDRGEGPPPAPRPWCGDSA
eukprot:8740725-Pyramimonas_sp.AAC.1